MKHLKKFNQIFEDEESVYGGKIGGLIKDFMTAFNVKGKEGSGKGKTFADIYSGDDSDGLDVDQISREGSPKSFISMPAKNQMDLIRGYLIKYGITNRYVQDAILATIGKESGYKHTVEISYKNTSPQRIRRVFGSRFSGMSDEEINTLKKDEKGFWNKVYGGEWGKRNLGNTQAGDGAKFVGRGYNGITGRSVYTNVNRIMQSKGSKYNILSNPEVLETSPDAMAESTAAYFLMSLGDSTLKRKHGYKDPNDIKDFDTALKVVINANAGAGTDITKGIAREGHIKAGQFASKYGLGQNDEMSRTA